MSGLLKKLREVPSRIIVRVPFLRRHYARFLARSIRKQRKKGQRLPPDLYRIERQIRHLPPTVQAEKLEELLKLSAKWKPDEAGRQLRRAADRAERVGSTGRGTRQGRVPQGRAPQAPKR